MVHEKPITLHAFVQTCRHPHMGNFTTEGKGIPVRRPIMASNMLHVSCKACEAESWIN